MKTRAPHPKKSSAVQKWIYKPKNWRNHWELQWKPQIQNEFVEGHVETIFVEDEDIAAILLH